MDQLDLFLTTNCDYEEEQRIKEKQRQVALEIERKLEERREFLTKNLTTRQHRLVDYLKDNFQKGRYFTIEELCQAGLGYELNTNPRIHDKCASLGNDIRQINWRIGQRYSIIVKDSKGSAKLCESQEEFDAWRDSELDKLKKKYEYLNTLKYKASFDGQVVLVNLNDKASEGEVVKVYKDELTEDM